MILFAILAVILILLTVITVLAIGTMGAGAIVIFGDVIVCIVFIILIIKWLITRKNKRR